MSNKGKTLLVLVIVITLSGCTTTADYYTAIDKANAKQAEIAREQAKAEKARVLALSEIAATGDEQARIAATMALAFSNNQSDNTSQAITPQPKRSEALEWASVIVPFASTLSTGYFNYRVGVTQSDNNRDVSIANSEAMTELGVGEFRNDGVEVPLDQFRNDGVETSIGEFRD